MRNRVQKVAILFRIQNRRAPYIMQSAVSKSLSPQVLLKSNSPSQVQTKSIILLHCHVMASHVVTSHRQVSTDGFRHDKYDQYSAQHHECDRHSWNSLENLQNASVV